jgi:hypothetical protein
MANYHISYMRKKFFILVIQAIGAATLISVGAAFGITPCLIIGIVILGTMIITSLLHEQSAHQNRPVLVLNPTRVLV